MDSTVDTVGALIPLISKIVLGASREELESLVMAGVDWKAKGPDGLTVLHVAAMYSNVEATRYFISLGADVNARALHGITPLHNLIGSIKEKRNFKEMLEIHVDGGADLYATTDNGDNLVMMAIRFGRSLDDMKQLISCGALWNSRNIDGNSVLHFAAEIGNLDAITYFVSKGAEVNARNVHGKTPLLQAALARTNFMEVVDLLLLKGAEINDEALNGMNLMFHATLAGKSAAELEKLLDRGCIWNREDKDGRSILHFAAQGDNLDALKLFIGKGGNVNGRDNREISVLMTVLSGGDKKNREAMVNVLMENGVIIAHVGELGMFFKVMNAGK